MLHRAVRAWWRVGGVTATSFHLPFISLFASYPGLVSAPQGAGKLFRKIRLWQSSLKGVYFLLHWPMASENWPHPCKWGLDQLHRSPPCRQSCLDPGAYWWLKLLEEGQRELVTTGPSLARGWEGASMPTGSCIDKLQHPWQQPRHKNGILCLPLEFLSFEILGQGIPSKRNQDTHINLQIGIRLFVSL